MNRVCLTGRVTGKPELRSNGLVDVTKFTIAINRNYKNANGEYESDFINCVAFNKRAEMIANHIEKGDMLGITGKIQTGSYTAKDGSKRYTTDVIVEDLDFLQSKNARNTQKYARNDKNVEKDTQKSDFSSEKDPFEQFGEQIDIDSNFLE